VPLWPQELRHPPPALRHTTNDLRVAAGGVLSFPCAALDDAAACCVGLTIDWALAPALRGAALAATLPEEHARAAAYLRPEDALRHLLGRALLRELAAGCAVADPRAPLRAAEPGGKPRWADQGFDGSISHAGDQVWVAIARGAQVGIDVDAQAALPDASEVVAGLHPREAAAVAASARPERAALRCWTRKEAVAKATGLGLSLPLQHFVVDSGETARGWLREAPPGTEAADWTTLDLPAAPGHLAAVALHGCCREVSVLRLQVTLEAGR
jgi:4'-phosphopantetheinyl transferase